MGLFLTNGFEEGILFSAYRIVVLKQCLFVTKKQNLEIADFIISGYRYVPKLDDKKFRIDLNHERGRDEEKGAPREPRFARLVETGKPSREVAATETKSRPGSHHGKPPQRRTRSRRPGSHHGKPREATTKETKSRRPGTHHGKPQEATATERKQRRQLVILARLGEDPSRANYVCGKTPITNQQKIGGSYVGNSVGSRVGSFSGNGPGQASQPSRARTIKKPGPDTCCIFGAVLCWNRICFG